MNSENQIKNIIITGASRGLGLKLVESILKLSKNQVQPKHNIIMTARDYERGMKEFHNLKKEYLSSQLFFYQLDVSNLDSINNFYQDYVRDFGVVDILINNAGVYVQGDILKKDYQSTNDIEMTLNVNFYGLINMNDKFLPILSKNGKIIQVSSDHGLLKNQTEKSQKLLNDETMTKEKVLLLADEYKLLNLLQKNDKYSKCIYQFSKALVNAYNRFVLSKLMRDDQLCLSLTPGSCDTDMGKQGQIDSKRPPQHSAQDGVDYILYVTFEIPFLANNQLNGAYFSYNCKEPSQF